MNAAGLICCQICGRRHRRESMVPDPDFPPRTLCPVTWRGLRLTPAERAEANRLLSTMFGGLQ